MRQIILAVSLFSAGSAFAAPNLYDCRAANGKTKILFSTSSNVGTPTMSVVMNGVSLTDDPTLKVNFSSTPSALGNLATLTTIPAQVADIPATVYMLAVPSINSSDDSKAVKFNTFLLIGRAGGFLAPGMATQEITKTIALSCTASRVFF